MALMIVMAVIYAWIVYGIYRTYRDITKYEDFKSNSPRSNGGH